MLAKKLYVATLGEIEPKAVFIIDQPQPKHTKTETNMRLWGVHVVAELGTKHDLANRLVAAWNHELGR